MSVMAMFRQPTEPPITYANVEIYSVHGTGREVHTARVESCADDSRLRYLYRFRRVLSRFGLAGALIFIIGASMGALGIHLFKSLKH